MSKEPPTLSMDERRVLFSLGHPWSTSKDCPALGGKDARRARLLCKLGLAENFALAGDHRWYFRRTQAGQDLARWLADAKDLAK